MYKKNLDLVVISLYRYTAILYFIVELLYHWTLYIVEELNLNAS